MKNLLKLLSLILTFTFLISCSDDDESPLLSAEENALISTIWKPAGLYAGGTLVPGTNGYTFQLEFQSTGVPGVPGAFKINGQTIPATWQYSNNEMTFIYLDPVSVGNGNVSPGTTALRASVDATNKQLDLFAPATGGDVNLFGVITIPQNNSFRFTETGDATFGSASSTLEATWDAQTLLVTTGGETTQGSPFTMTFGNYFGINTLFINDIPTPTTWTLSADNSVLTLSYPSSQSSDGQAGTIQFSVKGSIIGTQGSSFRLANDKTNTSVTLYGVIQLSAGAEIELTRK